MLTDPLLGRPVTGFTVNPFAERRQMSLRIQVFGRVVACEAVRPACSIDDLTAAQDA
jgi:hypothetical protein